MMVGLKVAMEFDSCQFNHSIIHTPVAVWLCAIESVVRANAPLRDCWMRAEIPALEDLLSTPMEMVDCRRQAE
jgi:hypothetical protein